MTACYEGLALSIKDCYSNKIKTKDGVLWLTVPVRVKGKYFQKIRETKIDGVSWQNNHWKSLKTNYIKAPYFDDLAKDLEQIYCKENHVYISNLNRRLIDLICNYLKIKTKIRDSYEFNLEEDKTERLVNICKELNANEYITGPSAKNYINQDTFTNNNFRTDGNGLGAANYNGTSQISNQWVRFVYVKNSKVFINNNATNRSNSQSDKPYGQLKIGDARSDVGQHWDGKIALVRVYNRSLSDQEISINYDGFNAVINNSQTSSGSSSSTSVDEEVSIGTEVGTLTATDSDTTNLTFSLVSGNGTNDQHNSIFTVSGTQLIVAGNIDYETNATLNIYVQVSDGENTYQKAMTVTVNDIKETPSINVSDIIKTFGSANFDLSATSSSTGAFTYTVTDQNVATANGNTVTIVGAGSTSITVTQAEDNNFATATATFTLTVNKTDLTISLADILKTFGDDDFNLSASSSSTGAFTYTIADQNIATINGVAVSIEGAGSTSITVTQAADNNYNTASKTINLSVAKATPTLSFNNVVKNYGDISFTIEAQSSETSDLLTLSPPTNTNPTYWYVSGVHGNASFYPNAPPGYSNTKYFTPWLDSPQGWSSNGLNLSQWIVLDLQEESMIYGIITKGREHSTGSQYVTKANVLYSNDNINWTTALNNTILNTTSNNSNPSVTKQFSTPVRARYVKIEPTAWHSYITLRMGVMYKTLGQSQTSSGTLTYTSSDNSVVSISGNTATVNGAGTSLITVTQSETTNYNATTSSFTITVNKIDPTLSGFSNVTKTFGDPSFEITPPTKNNDNTGVFTYSSSDPSIVSINNNNLTINGAGSVVLTANLASDNNYNSGSITTNITVEKANQTISIGALPENQPLKDFNSIPLSASSSSNAPIVVTLAQGSAASLSGGVGNYSLVSIQQTGIVTITFTTDDSNNPNYKTVSSTLSINVIKSNQSISYSTSPPDKEAADPWASETTIGALDEELALRGIELKSFSG